MRLNRAAGKHPVEIDPWLVDLIRKGKRFSLETDGAFSLDVLKYGIEEGLKPDFIERTLSPAGDRWIRVHPEEGTVFLQKQGMALDLGGIAKGYALDRAVEAMRGMKVDQFLLSLGRGLYAGEAPAHSSGWAVGVVGETEPRVVENVFISASAQGLRSDTGHVIDPRNGLPVKDDRRVVALAERGWLADATSTAVFVEPRLRDRLLRLYPKLQSVTVQNLSENR